jgi:hypothetical protein
MRRIFLVMLLCALAIPAVTASDFPDSWTGSLHLTSTARIESTNATWSRDVNVDGDLALTVDPTGTVAKGELTANWKYALCSAQGKAPVKLEFRGQFVGGAKPTIQVGMPTPPVVGWKEKVKCPPPFDKLFDLLASQAKGAKPGGGWIAPAGLNPIPLIDGAKTTQRVSGPPVDSTTTVKLVTPCERWDSTQDMGPKVTFSPDPRTFVIPTMVPDFEFNKEQLKARSREQVPWAQELGSTQIPEANQFERTIKVSTSTPRNSHYKECVSVDEVEVRFPIETIHSWIATEVGATGACADHTISHEQHHYTAAWNTLRSIASELEVSLRKFPGPFNALPSVVSGGQAVTKATVEQAISAIVERNLHEMQFFEKAFDDNDAAAVQAVCAR